MRGVASGAKTDRAQLRRLLDQLEAGDVLTVTRLDRLTRSTRDLLNTLATITGGEPRPSNAATGVSRCVTSPAELQREPPDDFEAGLVRSSGWNGSSPATDSGRFTETTLV